VVDLAVDLAVDLVVRPVAMLASVGRVAPAALLVCPEPANPVMAAVAEAVAVEAMGLALAIALGLAVVTPALQVQVEAVRHPEMLPTTTLECRRR
jgi:hypothetical protein